MLRNWATVLCATFTSNFVRLHSQTVPIVTSYNRKFKTLDVKFAADMVGDGKRDTKGQFETAQQQFLRGQVISMCEGWFGEINEDFDKTIKILAREAAA